MRRFASLATGLLATGLLATGLLASGALTVQANAQMQCLTPSQRAMFDVQALRSELMVLATGCGDDQSYNAFIRRYKPALMANEHEVVEYFRHRYGRRGQSEHDTFVTALANAQASRASRLGSEFCPRNGEIFREVMALEGSHQLPPFAAGQAVYPASMDVCPTEVAEAPVRHRPVVHHRPVRHRP